MKDISKTIKCKDKEYKLVFNLNVMELLQSQYGTIGAWGELCEPGGADKKDKEPDIAALKYGFWAMMNEAIDIDNETNNTNIPPLTIRQVGRIITDFGSENAFKALNDTVIESSKNMEKNESSTTNQ